MIRNCAFLTAPISKTAGLARKKIPAKFYKRLTKLGINQPCF